MEDSSPSPKGSKKMRFQNFRKQDQHGVILALRIPAIGTRRAIAMLVLFSFSRRN